MTIHAERDFAIVDVFTRDAGGGNPLAVFFDGRGISDTAMQRLAREFNFSETTFVLPSDRDDCDFRVRIFTPTREVPFAGHPNIGTACALAARGMLEQSQVRFEELAGRVVLTVDREQADHARLRAPETFSEGESYPIALVSSVLGLAEDEIDISVHDPCEASTGL
ncbi:MAG: PhzF family phenazine biosynthesis protein, partial [Pseudomonadota bacterium]